MVIFIVQFVFIHLEQETNGNVIKKYVKIKIFVEILCPLKHCNILKFNQCMKSNKTPCIIYEDLESLIKKIVKIIQKHLQEQK